jgi:hypothetical protein
MCQYSDVMAYARKKRKTYQTTRKMTKFAQTKKGEK